MFVDTGGRQQKKAQVSIWKKKKNEHLWLLIISRLFAQKKKKKNILIDITLSNSAHVAHLSKQILTDRLRYLLTFFPPFFWLSGKSREKLYYTVWRSNFFIAFHFFEFVDYINLRFGTYIMSFLWMKWIFGKSDIAVCMRGREGAANLFTIHLLLIFLAGLFARSHDVDGIEKTEWKKPTSSK